MVMEVINVTYAQKEVAQWPLLARDQEVPDSLMAEVSGNLRLKL